MRFSNRISSEDQGIIEEAAVLAETWQNRANALLSDAEKRNQHRMARLLAHPMDKVILARIMDQSFRPNRAERVADQLHALLDTYGIPSFLDPVEKLLMYAFQIAGRHLPAFSVPRVIERIRQDSRQAIVPGESGLLMPHLERRRQENVRMNINHLGEAVLGEAEALHRLQTYIEDLESPAIEYISVKISTIYSQISSLAFDDTVSVLCERLSRLFLAAKTHRFVRKDGGSIQKFVNLDMEEYRDLDITLQAFIKTLERPQFQDLSAGIVLQAYLPDSAYLQQELTRWAIDRVNQGGAPIKIRIVKGANMEMELVESALNNWPLAPFDNKLDVDANYKRMVDWGARPEHIRAVHLGIASHNLFELAYAYARARRNGALAGISLEMLEGMADHIRRAIQEIFPEVLLYAPVAARDQFINAIAYLIRRLDENTAPDNFLRHSFRLSPGSPEWRFLKDQFIRSVSRRHHTPHRSNRKQNRQDEIASAKTSTFVTGEFINEPDTDWSLAANRKWAEAIREKWMKTPEDAPIEIPIVVSGKSVYAGRKILECIDPSQIGAGFARPPVTVARCALADAGDLDAAVRAAKEDTEGWRKRSIDERHALLSRVAVEFRRARADLIGAAAANTGKVFTEADIEVSEAIDFLEFYPHSARTFWSMPHVAAFPKGVGLVISPWNFPISIPVGGISAALAAGNTVIFKPASAAVLVAWELCQCFWRAGIPQTALQFVPCPGELAGSRLVGNADIDFIILTGGTDTGMRILRQRPNVWLAAETGGKNATIVTAMADRDQAIKNVIHSAFSNCGQKCSATSLLILESEVYHDEDFKRRLLDAAQSLKVGSAWRFENRMGPLVSPPQGPLLRGLNTLDPGERWLLQPTPIDGNPHLWTPGIKWGVRPGSFTHMTELFGPVLGVMEARSLDHAISLANQTGYGLTAGIESLDVREQERWKAKITAGNLYINRGTTGAVVLRQPFGGMKKSALGAGIKAGGPNYVAQFMRFEDRSLPPAGPIRLENRWSALVQRWKNKLLWGQFEEPAEIEKTIRAIQSDLFHMENEFGVEKDYFHLRGQDNVVRYLPAGRVCVRVHLEDTLFETLARIAAARIAGCSVVVSMPFGLPEDGSLKRFLSGPEAKILMENVDLVQQTDESLARSLGEMNRLRYAAPDRVPELIYREAGRMGFTVSRAAVCMEGRIELLHYLQEQSICNNYHRYGNIGERSVMLS
ncbi:bifunctional proline dehydrogenase/L-glutamate gamma-semialdehyde dehydrogenase [Desulfatirhabdium butyrativorans]|uniref:bifunctional proline dehydrogenase/L-glutamate gamma-semialdehyde dehydrogenase n=1 Tax=Desulfatirhabdium butyrativorans TaxID=340467 RepID=UPI00040651C0|nr:proline dehydrogenase family protein [Desulfatirhabdium butyrativorans]